MNDTSSGASAPLPPEVLAALQRGDTIDAIKHLREARGIGLKEAKDLLDAHVRGAPAASRGLQTHESFPPDVAEAMRRGEKIEAIRLLRAHNGMGLAAAKEAVERLQETQAGLNMPAPGAMPASGRFAWLFVATMVILVIVLFLFRNT